MPRNVEVKAKLNNFDKVLSIIKNICKSSGTLLNQEDIFFTVPHGRLKLRNFKDDTTSQLICYKRPDIGGPKISDYSICKVENSEDLLEVLKSALGIVGVVKKKRLLFIHGQTRIHLDTVENLGDFLELEVVLDETQELVDGEIIAHELLKTLEICDKDLITGAYIDLQ